MTASINSIISECKNVITIENGYKIKKLITELNNCRTRKGFYSISFANNYFVYEQLGELLSYLTTFKKIIGSLNDIYIKTKENPNVYDLSEVIEDLHIDTIIKFDKNKTKIVDTGGDLKMIIDHLNMIENTFNVFSLLWKYASKKSMGESYNKCVNQDFTEYNNSILKIYENNKNFIASIKNFLNFIDVATTQIEKRK